MHGCKADANSAQDLQHCCAPPPQASSTRCCLWRRGSGAEAGLCWEWTSEALQPVTRLDESPSGCALAGAQQTPKASDLHKLPRSRFLHLLCTELHRIECTITAALPATWNGMQHDEGHGIHQADIFVLLNRADKVGHAVLFVPLMWPCLV